MVEASRVEQSGEADFASTIEKSRQFGLIRSKRNCGVLYTTRVTWRIKG
jgi:hypothetical protein